MPHTYESAPVMKVEKITAVTVVAAATDLPAACLATFFVTF